ncbi:MAG: amidophosphoribosyltransferase, partial [Oscillospiraceae bacterium]|nr:amidophosphoribosyltransferase [Oscillospiraceae bacterium]
MGGFFGAVSKRDTVMDVFFGTDYHSHLGTRRGGMAAWDPEKGFQRDIHNIENAPFRTKFEKILDEMSGNICIGSISDTDPQPLLVRSKLGTFAISTVGVINNSDALIAQLLDRTHGHFESMSGSR